MSKVARAARVASKQRTEAISADKTIADAETGETYLVSGSAAVTVTLPAPADGAYFTFIYGTGMTQNMILQRDGVQMAGRIINMATQSAAVTPSAGDDTVTLSGVSGDSLECLSDGVGWLVTGVVSGTVSFSNP